MPGTAWRSRRASVQYQTGGVTCAACARSGQAACLANGRLTLVVGGQGSRRRSEPIVQAKLQHLHSLLDGQRGNDHGSNGAEKAGRGSRAGHYHWLIPEVQVVVLNHRGPSVRKRQLRATTKCPTDTRVRAGLKG